MASPASTFEGTITEWAPKSPFGYAEWEEGRVFLHISNFAQRFKWPEVNDEVRFSMGTDEQGRPCAQNIVLLSEGGILSWKHLVLVGLLLILPGFAIPHLREWLSPWWIIDVFLITSILATVNLWFDKHYAKRERSRIPEATLHLFELTGGWAGSFLAQRYLRHKISKRSYQVVFWLIVLMYQLLALDVLLDGFLISGLRDLSVEQG